VWRPVPASSFTRAVRVRARQWACP
jgi:hypothetical protein